MAPFFFIVGFFCSFCAWNRFWEQTFINSLSFSACLLVKQDLERGYAAQKKYRTHKNLYEQTSPIFIHG